MKLSHIMKYKYYIVGSLVVLGLLYMMYMMSMGSMTQTPVNKRPSFLAIDNSDVMTNIYGQPLQTCLEPDDKRGSGDQNGYCSEQGGGVHQICMNVNSKSKNFARDTNQGTNWSLDREGKNHCMCLGAWALYKKKQELNEIPRTHRELQCDAISQISLSDTYTQKWNTWNGHEKPDQIVNGITELVGQCYHQNVSPSQKEYLQSLYCNFTADKDEFKPGMLYKELCE